MPRAIADTGRIEPRLRPEDKATPFLQLSRG